MVRNTQGYRKDLNLSETEVDKKALDALAGSGTADNLSYLQNNLRNTSSIAYRSIDSEGFFSNNVSRILPATSITTVIDGNKTNIQIQLSDPFLLEISDQIQLSGIENKPEFNRSYSLGNISTDLKNITLINYSEAYGGNLEGIDGTTDTIVVTLLPIDLFTYTNDDIVTVSEEVTINITDPASNNASIASTTLSPNKNYFVCDSDALTKFRLSNKSSVSGVDKINIPEGSLAGKTVTVTPEFFNFIRKEPVHQENLVNYIKPPVQDDQYFSWIGSTINGTFDSTQQTIEIADIVSERKYKGTADTTTDDSIKLQGAVVLHDPDNFNSSFSQIEGNSDAPGMYIGDVRAFSSDNNPWEKSDDGNPVGILSTQSYEISIGDLAFLDGNNIDGSFQVTGVNLLDVSPAEDAKNFTHKMPVVIEDENGNKETFSILLTKQN